MRLLGFSPREFLIVDREVVATISKLTGRTRYLITLLLLAHQLLLILTYLALSLRVILSISALVVCKLILAAFPTLIHLLHLVLILLQSCLIVVKNYLLLGASILVIGRLLTVGSTVGRINLTTRSYIITRGSKALVVELAIVTIPLLLL